MTVNKWAFLLIQVVLNGILWFLFFELGEMYSVYVELFSPVAHLIFTTIIFITMYKRKVKALHWKYLLIPFGLMLLTSAATGQLFIQYTLKSELGYHIAGFFNFLGDLSGRIPAFIMAFLIFRNSKIKGMIIEHIAFQYGFLLIYRSFFYIIEIDIFSTMILPVILNEILSLSFVTAYVYFTYLIIHRITVQSNNRKVERIEFLSS